MQTKQTGVTIEIGQTFPLTIKRLGINGEGVGYFKKKVVFVEGALPGEEVVVQATKVHPKFTEAKIKKIRKHSKHRVDAPCPIFDSCGGCQLQHLEYNEQLNQKRDIVIQAMERHAKLKLTDKQIKQTLGMKNPWEYRNKSQFQTGLKKGKVVAGLYALNSHELINIDHCIIQHPLTETVTNGVKRILQDLQIPIYNERNRKGLIRTIVVRAAIHTKEVQVVFITAKEHIPKESLLIREIENRLPQVKSIIKNVNGEKTSLIFGDKTLHLAGKQVIEERLGDLSFNLSARAFFQLNTEQTVVLYEEVKKAAKLTGNEKVVDAYCGVGTIGLWVADQAKEIRGMDVISDSIEDARKNAQALNYRHAHYETGKAETLMPKWVKEGWRPDVVMVDPPRTGCDQAFLKTLLKVKPKRIVYVSCNPSTLAKDLQFLSKAYKVDAIQPVDMFPHTSHVESIAQLTLI
ncbi:23S rRNA (uracil(1939)-C(5))-methyltransferase RlmD [Bacillus carboniphilus]|uniref:23S rRNA (Uracil(1939)-C(5))-methyltransferase RlmD n=1 Tax=Bacillus carboniphilus TaxID=86663 RepID=A0ABY9JUT3_9BACI|nr:23S rRNA (uracil(1939)-C(5))-methyltransferase RlmD [Bacillus carboniphilus]WLR42539.1 23S rRNA (uracil(1939)-C(5))-methyltransferase RlmD [Bacillus carboniphilus]